MTVAINARAAVRTEIGGVERVARELADRLPELRPDRYRVVAPPPAFAHAPGHAWEQAVLPVRTRGDDLLLSPANLAPLASPHSVVMVYDVAPFLGDWYAPAYARWHRWLLPRVVHRARRVLTTSTLVAGQIHELMDVPAERIGRVALGVDERFHAPADPEPLRARLGLERPYVLAVGTDIARKNLALLDRIAPSLADAGLEVVLAGSTRPYMPGGGHRARSLGYVPDADLPALYAGAAVLAMPSWYEGFGLPCLEAMATGTPVVAADRGALPETCGDAALLADPGDDDAFAAALVAAAGPERARLVDAGSERARRFTWDAAARAVDAELDALLDG